MSLFSKKNRLVYFTLFSCTAVFANPHDPAIVSGSAKVSQNGKELLIETGHKAIINWKGFSIDKGELTRFIQPGKDSSVLNRVYSGTPSSIMGALEANGKVYLINPSGILIGKDAIINTAAFTLSTLDVLDEEFLEGKTLSFSGDSNSFIQNFGTINAWDGDVVFLSYKVDNQGTISAPKGHALLGAGLEILLKPDGDERLFIIPSTSNAEQSEIDHSGAITALQAELKAEGNPYALAIKQSGKIEALSQVERNGRVYLVSDKGSSAVSGSIAAQGGEVRVLGNRVGILDNAKIDVSSDKNAGTILIGGDYQGNNPQVRNAEIVVVDPGVNLIADSNLQGDGGKIIAWADVGTAFYGKVSAQGGKECGDGGFVEISGKRDLDFRGEVSTFAPMGKTGTLLLDPSDISIVAALTNTNIAFSTANMTTTYTATAATASVGNAFLTSNALQSLTANNVIISTASIFGSPGDITVSAPVTWSSNFNLTLQADRNINVNDTLQNASPGTGSIILTAGTDVILTDTGADVASLITNAGNVNVTAGRNLTIMPVNQNAFIQSTTGAINIKTGNDLVLQGGSVAITPAFIESTSGPVNITAGHNLSVLGGSLSDASAFITAANNTTTLTVGNDVTVVGGSDSSAFAAIGGPEAAANNIVFNGVGRDVIVGSSSAAGYSLIGIDIGANPGSPFFGNITFNQVGRNVQLIGSTAGAEGFAQIGHTNTSGTPIVANGNVSVLGVGGSVILTGGGDNNSAIIGHGNPDSVQGDTYIGNIQVSTNGPTVPGLNTILLTAGAGSNATAAIGFESSINGALGSMTTISASNVSASSTNGILLNAGTSGANSNAVIGFYNELAQASVNITNTSAVTPSTVTLNAGANNSAAAIGAFVDQARGSVDSNVSVFSGNLFLNGPALSPPGKARILNRAVATQLIMPGMSDVTIVAQDINLIGGTVNNLVDINSGRNLNIFFSGNLNIDNTTPLQVGHAQIESFFDLNITGGGNLTILGPSTLGSECNITSTNGNVVIQNINNMTLGTPTMAGFVEVSAPLGSVSASGSGNLSMNGGAGVGNTVDIFAGGDVSLSFGGNVALTAGSAQPVEIFSGMGNVSVQSGGSTTLTSTSALINSSIDGPGSVNVTAGTDINIGLNSVIEVSMGSGNLNATAGNNFNVFGEIANLGSGSLIAKAGVNMQLFPTTKVHTTTGQLDLVVDNKFPKSPQIGNGKLIIDPGAAIFSMGPVRLFTARRSLNSIEAPINGATFTPGPAYIDSNEEQWGTYFPSSFGGFPFTIFYKSVIPAVLNEANNAFYEFLRNLKTYDDFLYTYVPFFLEYDRKNLRKEVFPYERFSSYDLYEETNYSLLRQAYRNYNTKKYDQL